jgi:hypothetical protein
MTFLRSRIIWYNIFHDLLLPLMRCLGSIGSTSTGDCGSVTSMIQ